MVSNNVTFKVNTDLKGFQKGLTSVSSGLNSIARTSAIAFTGLSAIIGVTTNNFVKFEKQIANTITLLSGDEVKQFGTTIKELTNDAVGLGFGIEKSGKAMFDTVSALGANKRAFETFRESQNLALAGATDISIAVDGVTSVLNAYTKEAYSAERASQIFYATQKRGKTTVGLLAGSIGRVAPQANALGISFEKTGAALATLTLAGLSTEESSTRLNAFLTSLIRNRKELEEVGVVVADSEGNFRDFTDIMQDLNKATDGNLIKNQDLLKNIRAVSGASLLLSDNMSVYKRILNDIETDTGSYNEALKAQMNTFGFVLQQAKGAGTKLAIAFGSKLAPTLKDVTKEITKFTNVLNDLDPETFQKLANGALALALAFGMLTIVTKVTAGLFTMSNALITLSKIAGPLTTLAVAIIAVTAGLAKMAEPKLSERIQDSTNNLAKFIKQYENLTKKKFKEGDLAKIDDIIGVSGDTRQVLRAISNEMKTLQNLQAKQKDQGGIFNFTKESLGGLKDAITEIANAYGSAGEEMGNSIIDVLDKVNEKIDDTKKNTGDLVGKTGTATKSLVEFTKAQAELLSQSISQITTALVGEEQDKWKQIKSIVRSSMFQLIDAWAQTGITTALMQAGPTLGASLAEIPQIIGAQLAGKAGIVALGFSKGGIVPKGDKVIAGFNPQEQVLTAKESSMIQSGDYVMSKSSETLNNTANNVFNFDGATFGENVSESHIRRIFETASEMLTNKEMVFQPA